MLRTSVSSSNLHSVVPDAVEIAFHSSSVYVYDRVPADVYAGLMRAAS